MSPTRADLLQGVEARLPAMVDGVCDEVRRTYEFYRRGDVVTPDDLHHAVTRNLRHALAALAHPDEVLDSTTPSWIGRRRAEQGAPLPEVLGVYRLLHRRLWLLLADQARERPTDVAFAGLMLTVADDLWRIADQQALVLSEAYRLTMSQIEIGQQRRRAALVDALFTGEVAAGTPPYEIGKLIGFPLDAAFVVVVAENTSPAQEGLPGVEKALDGIGCVSAWQLTSSAQRGVVGIRDDVEREQLSAVLTECVTGRAGVSPPYSSLIETPRAVHLARTALSSIPAGAVEVRAFSPSPLAALVAYDPTEGRRLVEDVLGAVLRLPRPDADLLLATVSTYLAAGGSVEDVATRMDCHPNTVRYRIRRIRELTGRSLGDPRAAAELTVATEAVAIFTAPA